MVPKTAHSSRGTPLSLGWRAVSLPQASAATSPAHDYLSCSAGKWVLEPRGSSTDGEAPLCHFWAGQGRLWDRSAPLLQAKCLPQSG